MGMLEGEEWLKRYWVDGRNQLIYSFTAWGGSV